MFRIHPTLLRFTPTTRMTSIRGRERLCRERTSKGLSEFSPPLESSHDKSLANLPVVKFLVIKYTKKDLQKILRTVFKAQVPPFDGVCEKLLKARLPDIYYGNSHIEYYNFC